jgi:peptidoglycan/LPS O-acetylase OafA/YrhL
MENLITIPALTIVDQDLKQEWYYQEISRKKSQTMVVCIATLSFEIYLFSLFILYYKIGNIDGWDYLRWTIITILIIISFKSHKLIRSVTLLELKDINGINLTLNEQTKVQHFCNQT